MLFGRRNIFFGHRNIRWGRVAFVAAVMVSLTAITNGRAAGQGKLRVVTTLPDLASIAQYIGGDHVETFSIAAGFQNPHFVDPKPSFIRQLSRADLFVTVGLDLESGWVPPLLNSARNAGILQGAPGYVDASVGVPLLQLPTAVSREQGDIHVYGNPHYWLDPERGKIIAKNIADGLGRLRPEDRSDFQTNLERFNKEADARIEKWLSRMKPYRGARIVAYHNSWPYLAERFGLNVVDFLEPKPGIPPTPSQLAKIIRLMTEEDIRVIIIEPYFKTDAADLVARKVDGQVVVLATSVGAEESIRTYFDLFEYNVDKLVGSLRDSKQHQEMKSN